MLRLAAVIAIGFTTLWSVPVRADLEIPTGGFMSLADGGLGLGCTDLIVGGTLQTNSAGVAIPVTAQTRCMMVAFADASGLPLINTIQGYYSGGLVIN